MEPTFKPGDVVQLKSGGPPMTVASVATAAGGGCYQAGRTYAHCLWHCSSCGEIHGHDFYVETLNPYFHQSERPKPLL
jgi:uncharacterized protein YodC (DUF2158 family)